MPEAEDDGWQSETFRAYGVKALPTVALIDDEGWNLRGPWTQTGHKDVAAFLGEHGRVE